MGICCAKQNFKTKERTEPLLPGPQITQIETSQIPVKSSDKGNHNDIIDDINDDIKMEQKSVELNDNNTDINGNNGSNDVKSDTNINDSIVLNPSDTIDEYEQIKFDKNGSKRNKGTKARKSLTDEQIRQFNDAKRVFEEWKLKKIQNYQHRMSMSESKNDDNKDNNDININIGHNKRNSLIDEESIKILNKYVDGMKTPTKQDTKTLKIKIQSMNSNFPIITIKIKETKTIHDLKKKISKNTPDKVDISRQRLIHRGRLLKNDDKSLKKYKINSKDIVMLVRSSGNNATLTVNNGNNSQSNSVSNIKSKKVKRGRDRSFTTV